MFFLIIFYIHLCLFDSILSSSSNTLVFSAGPNSYVAFDSWRPCLNGYVRFDIRTNAHDGTLAYIDDRGKFDFFYLKLIEGKLRLLFNLGNDRQALNVNMNVDDDQWHTILIKRDGQTTTLSIDNGRASNSTITNADDLYFGGANQNEYQASPFYFGGIPAALERPSSGNLSSFDVYLQPRFRGRLRNLIYKNCSNPQLVQPVHLQISGGVSLVPHNQCSTRSCGPGLCLINESSYQCLCDETDFQGDHCQIERKSSELTFDGKRYFNYRFRSPIVSSTEMIEFRLKTMHYDGLIFQLADERFTVRLKQGQIYVDYRWDDQLVESSSKDLHLIDNQWHQIQIKRKRNQITLMIDEYLFQFDFESKHKEVLNFNEMRFAGRDQNDESKFVGCLKEFSIEFNENNKIHFDRTLLNDLESTGCSSLLSPIEFLVGSSFLSFVLPEEIQKMYNYQLNISFYFQTFSSEGIVFYATHPSSEDFLGLDLIDGFLYLTINRPKTNHRQELFQQRVNDGQRHFFHLYLQAYQGGSDIQIFLDRHPEMIIPIRNFSSIIQLETLTLAAIRPTTEFLPNNFWSGIMRRSFIGCISDFQLNGQAVNLTKFINGTLSNMAPKIGPCSLAWSTKRECSCEHGGECRTVNSGPPLCDCSKTGYTGRRCEHPTFHIDLSSIRTFEIDTQMQWSEQINDIAFGLKAATDRESFLQVRPCRTTFSCDSVNFSIRNGLLQIDYIVNRTIFTIDGEYPFLLDNQWHYIRLYRMDSKFLLHIDHHIDQKRFDFGLEPNRAQYQTIWLVFSGEQHILVEDLRIYDQSINGKYFLNNQYEQIKLKNRPWKPLNTISFYDGHDDPIGIQLNDILCQECQLDNIYFDFRTTEYNGLVLFANIQTTNPKSRSDGLDKDGQYLMIKLVDGQLHLIIIVASANEDEDEIHQIQTQNRLNDGHWHHVSLHRASEHHLELMIDSREYHLLASIHFLDAIYFGRPSFLSADQLPFNHIQTLKSCLSSVTLNDRSINLHEHIPSQSLSRTSCFLNSQCRLRSCQNTGHCIDRNLCDCQHTSFQGRFCNQLRTGFTFNEFTPGLIFDQPFQPEKRFQSYRLSFGMVTSIANAEMIRVSDQIQIELHRGQIRIKIAGQMQADQEFLHHNTIVNDGAYHLIQIRYNYTGSLGITVDNQIIQKQLSYRLVFDKPLLLLIGQNQAFRQGFQGQLYGLESDVYSVFDLISPTFQRLSYAPVQDKSFSPLFPNISSPMILRPVFDSVEDSLTSLCSYQPYDDICMMTAESSMSPLNYPDPSVLTSVPKNSTLMPSKSSTVRLGSSITTVTSPMTLAYSIEWNSSNNSLSDLMNSTTVSSSSSSGKRIQWKKLWIYIVPSICGLILCLIFALLGYIKYRRKDVGVYEVEEAQRFRPLIVELPSPSGESSDNTSHPSSSLSPSNPKKSSSKNAQKNPQKKRRNKKTTQASTDEQREFYI